MLPCLCFITIPVFTRPVWWNWRGVWSIVLTISTILERPNTKSLGVGCIMSCLFMSLKLLLHVLYLSLYGIESVPSVRPPGSGLTWNTFAGVMFWLRRGSKVGHSIVVIPCCSLSAFILKGLDLPMQWGERDHSPTLWWEHHGFSHMVFSIGVNTLNHPNCQLYVHHVCW